MKTNISLQEIRMSLAQYLSNHSSTISPFPKELVPGDPMCASVLICFQNIVDEWHIVFIKRSQNDLDSHSGQVAFPGGKCDREDENQTAAALREAEEEIGISASIPILLGELPEHLTITNYLVKPIICQIPFPYAFNLDTTEVEKIFTIPLKFLADPKNRHTNTRNLPTIPQQIDVIFFEPYEEEILWGASARITFTLLCALGLV